MKLLPIDTKDLSAYLPNAADSNLDSIAKNREAESVNSTIFTYGFMGSVCVFDGDLALTTQASIFDSGTIADDSVVLGGQSLGFGFKLKNVADFSASEQTQYSVEANEIKNLYLALIKVGNDGRLVSDHSTDVVFRLNSKASGVTLESLKFLPTPVTNKIKDVESYGWLFDENVSTDHIGLTSSVSMSQIRKDDFISFVLPYDTYPDLIVARHRPKSDGTIGDPLEYMKIPVSSLSTVFGTQKWALAILGQSKFNVVDGSRASDVTKQSVYKIDEFEVLGDQ